MKTFIRLRALWAVLVLAGTLVVPSASGQGLGIAAGLNYNQLSDIETGNRQAAFESASGWHVAVWYDLAVGPLAIRPGVRYMDAGSLFEGVDIDAVSGDADVNYSLSLIEIPVDLRFRLGLPFLKPYVLAGPVLRIPSSEEGDVELARDFSVAAELGAGVEIGFGGLRLYPEVKYTFGISQFTQDTYTIPGNINLVVDESSNLNVIMLSLGIGL